MANKDEKKDKLPPVVHGKAHPDHGKFNVIVAEASDEAVKKEQETMQAAIDREKGNAPDWRDLPDAKGKTARTGETTDADVDYESKTVPELKELAAQRGVDVPADAVKADIIKALKKNEAVAA